ncbi:MAG: hypothetical protein LBT38_09540 [Deltaproteobacteria bacterium]|jgi:hypothetical protein|nr:hypothetical protein [Deltaproteobacteria bacterium]
MPQSPLRLNLSGLFRPLLGPNPFFGETWAQVKLWAFRLKALLLSLTHKKLINWPKNILIFLIIALIFFVQIDPAQGADIRDYFVKAPDSLAHGLSAVDRRALLNIEAQKQSQYSTPSPSGFWVEIHGPSALTLFGYHRSPIVFKTFDTQERWKLLAICQSRQTSGPTEQDPASPGRPYDLTLMQVDHNDELNTALMGLYIPPISVLDFVTADTLTDRQAARDLAIINEDFESCLTCHASVLDPKALDILTVTTINGHSCLGFLPQFKLLPLAWNGRYFTKPHDRAAPPEDRRPQPPEGQHGPYYRPPAD